MSCLTDGVLRAYLDGELEPGRETRVMTHLAACPDCRARLKQQTETVRLIGKVLHADEPLPVDTEAALYQLRSTLESTHVSTGFLRRITMFSKHPVGRWVAVGVLLVTVLASSMFFAPTRALARQFLSIFRVQEVAVVPIEADMDQLESIEQDLDQVLSGMEPQVIVESEPVDVGSPEEAGELAGFQVRTPSAFADLELDYITVAGPNEYIMPVTADALQLLFELADMPEAFPQGFDQGEISILMPAVVAMGTDDLTVMQAWDISVEYPEGIEPSRVGEAGLRVMGVAPERARQFSETVDWANTLVLPIPTQAADFKEVDVAGEPGVMIMPVSDAPSPHGTQRTTLIWERDDVVYVVAGSLAPEQLLDIAVSMF